MPLLPAAIGIILTHDKSEVLLVKRRDLPIWVLPGGGIECGESPQEALIREVEEETGLTVSIQRHCAEYTPINRLSTQTSIFLCSPLSGTLSLSSETDDIAYHPLNNLPPSLFHLHAHWLQESLSSETLIQRQLTEVSYAALTSYFCLHPWQVLRFAWTRLFKR
jgi:8-oxo-dGTP pyrophosphatase MutT (NUDIX family)